MAGRLKDKYAIVGIGQTEFSKDSGRTTRHLGVEAIRMAMQDAGLEADEVDGMLSYSGNDSTDSPTISGDLGIRLDFYMDVSGGGSSTEALIGLAMGAIEVGMCNTVAIFRAMNGYTEARIGGTGRQTPVFRGNALDQAIYGMNSAGQSFAPAFMRAHVRVRDDQRAARAREGGAQQARLEQPEGLLPGQGDGGGRRQLALDHEAAAPPRLLRGDGQRERVDRDEHRARA